MRFLRSLLSGGLATIADVGTLALLVGLGLHPRVASLPALLLGAIVSFLANRSFAFRARGDLGRHAIGFSVVELLALAWNAVLFDVAMRLVPAPPVLLRLVTTNVVYLAWSYPLWRLVFRPRARVVDASA